MNGYTKLFQSIVTSSIWTEDDRTRIVWVTLLALADKHGEIQAAIPGLARLAGVTIEDCQKAIDRFMSPDPHSRTSDFEGRRLEKIDGGWALLNHAKYRRMASDIDRKEQATERKRRQRERDVSRGAPPKPDESRNVTPSHALPVTSHASVTPSHTSVTPEHAKADTEAKAEADTKAQHITPLPPCQGEAASAAVVSENQPSAISVLPECEKPHESGIPAESKRARKRVEPMLPPTIEQVKLHCAKIGLPETEAYKFHGYYTGNGWKVGRNAMKSWVGAMTNWKGNYDERRTNQRQPQLVGTNTPNDSGF